MKSTVEMLKGKVTTISLRLEGGLTIEHEGKWKKYAIAPEMTVSVGPTDDFEAKAAELEAYISAWIGKYLKPIEEHYAPENPVLHDAPVAPKAPVAQDAQQLVDEDTFVAETITVEYTPGGEKRAKVKGGRWLKYGVTCWPEVLKMPPLEWDLDALDAADYPVSAGVTAIVMMLDDKPKKVTEWK